MADSVTCTACKRSLSSSSFHKYKAKKNGLKSACRECISKTHAKHHLNNKEQRNAKNRRYRADLKKEVYDHYGSTCQCCGESDPAFLSVDHIGNDGADHRREISNGRHRWGGGERTYNWIKKNNFPDTFQILCINCNWAKSRGGCPHQNTSKLVATQS